MSDEKDLISEIVEMVRDVREFVKHPNVQVATAYGKNIRALTESGAFAAVAIVSGMLTAGGPVISTQQPIRKPDEHIASQSHASEIVTEASNTLEDTLVSVVQVSTWDDLQLKVDEQAQLIRDILPKIEDDKSEDDYELS
jgi:hypothetical protein